MTNPHSNWAEYYDSAYELSFDSMYKEFTLATLEYITNKIPPPAKIIDFGAGTGRLAIPLSNYGYQVTAVEPCVEMLNQLIIKANTSQINYVNKKIEDYQSTEKYDMALSVFTVILYLLDDNSLQKSFISLANSLKSGGYLMIDIPKRNLFHSFSIENSQIKRHVVTTPLGNDLYSYSEDTTIFYENSSISYTDSFYVKYWEEPYIINILTNNFTIEEQISGQLNHTGSSYYLLRKK
jgi:SAM-dependent methyltransferase